MDAIRGIVGVIRDIVDVIRGIVDVIRDIVDVIRDIDFPLTCCSKSRNFECFIAWWME